MARLIERPASATMETKAFNVCDKIRGFIEPGPCILLRRTHTTVPNFSEDKVIVVLTGHKETIILLNLIVPQAMDLALKRATRVRQARPSQAAWQVRDNLQK